MLLQLYNANLARTEGFQLLIVAKGGNMDVIFSTCF